MKTRYKLGYFVQGAETIINSDYIAVQGESDTVETIKHVTGK